MFENGLYSLMKANIPDFNNTDNNGNAEYQMYYLAVFDPVPLPYAVFKRYRRVHEMDLESVTRKLTSSYIMEIYHNDSWKLLDLQQRIRTLLEALPFTNVGGIYVQQLEVNDDFHMIPPAIQEVRIKSYTGILDFEMVYNPN